MLGFRDFILGRFCQACVRNIQFISVRKMDKGGDGGFPFGTSIQSVNN